MLKRQFYVEQPEVKQSSLFKIPKGQKILKHYDMVTITREFANMDAIRFFNSCLIGKYQKEEFDREEFYPVDIDYYAKQAKISRGKAYDEAYSLAKRFLDTSITVDLGKGNFWDSSLIYEIQYNKDQQVLKIKWNMKLIPLISGNMERGKFLYIDARMSDIKSSKRYFLYEFLQKHLYLFDKQKEIVVTTSDLRDAAKVDSSEYLEFKELNRRLIKPTLQDIYKQLGVKLTVKGNKHTVTFTRGD